MDTTAAPRGFRPDIQGLRAAAVLLVVAYHLYPNRVSGGFVGVDVFFVLSGYLITAHLHREAAATGRIALGGFWARRIRRLLPASLLVLAVSALLTWWWIPASLWDQTLRQIGASTLYLQNWALAADAVDYSAAGNTPTLVQHYWSLSVEEQFYVLWPLLAVGALLLVRRRGAAALRRALLAAIAALGVVSLAYSVLVTADDAARAYFVTPTRVWEFAAGALLALLVLPRLRPAYRELLGWAGLVAVVASGMLLDGETAFPGWIALVPVLGTVAVVAAGATGGSSAGRLLSWRPATFVGDISYAVYLWHWPLIVVVPFVTGVDLRTRDKVAIFVATLLVSWASTRWFEDPLRRSRRLGAAPWRGFALGAAGMAAVLAGTAALQADLEQRVRDTEARYAGALRSALEGARPCFGPVAMDAAHRREHDCGPVAGPGRVRIDPAAVARQNTEPEFPGCQSGLDETTVRTCDLGTTREPDRVIAVVGDSHATHWFSALDQLGRERGWLVRTYTRSSCPFTDARRTLPDEPPARYRACRAGNREVERRLLADEEVDMVLTSSYSSAYGWAQPPGPELADPATDGFRAAWRRLTDAGRRVVVIRDVPGVKDKVNTPVCLGEHPDDVVACGTRRAEGLTRDVAAEAARGAEGVGLVDLTDRFCDAERCHAVVGDVVVYRDYSHLSAEYSALLAPFLGAALDRLDP